MKKSIYRFPNYSEKQEIIIRGMNQRENCIYHTLVAVRLKTRMDSITVMNWNNWNGPYFTYFFSVSIFIFHSYVQHSVQCHALEAFSNSNPFYEPLLIYTCDKFQRGIREVFLSFLGVF